jgi:hypothetical protein
MGEREDRLRRLESEIERRLVERFAAIRDEFDRLRLESDRRWASFVSHFDQDFRGIVPPELAGGAEPSALDSKGLPDRPAGTGLLSIEIARNLDDAGNQVEALHRFLELCRRHASRAALLISKAGSLIVWKATGFSEHGGNDDAARRLTLPLDGGALSRVLEGSSFRLAKGNDVSQRLGASNASAAVLVPMVVKEKVSGAVYADCTPEEASRFDPESIAFLTFLAGLFVDRLAGRKLKPAPALRPLEPLEAPGASDTSPRMPSPVVEASASASEGESSSPGRVFDASDSSHGPTAAPPPPRFEPEFGEPEELRPAPAPAPERERELEPGKPATAESEPSLAYPEDEPAPPVRRVPDLRHEPPRRPTAAPTPTPAPTPARPTEVAPKKAPEPAAAEAGSRPSVGARKLAGPLAALEGDERREEARRFAKLLVSEIKLYNEKAVNEGRQQGNLYGRLKEDIDRSRQMYDERIPEDVRSSSNFFYEELVRILAEGRAEALGI